MISMEYGKTPNENSYHRKGQCLVKRGKFQNSKNISGSVSKVRFSVKDE